MSQTLLFTVLAFLSAFVYISAFVLIYFFIFYTAAVALVNTDLHIASDGENKTVENAQLLS